MPRKRKQEKLTRVVVVNNTPLSVTLHPPTDARTSWYAYWPGLATSKSTGQASFDDAYRVVEDMVKNDGRKPTVQDAILSDEEFIAIQHRHYARKTDPLAQARAAKTLEDCLDAINAFKAITGMPGIASATPDDCANFQVKALTLSKNWRHHHVPSDGERRAVALISPSTIVKWSRQLQAAFERANRNAQKKKCVRGVVDERKLLTSNPWNQFTWIEDRKRPIRQFSHEELLSLLTFFETRWNTVSVGAAAAKTFLWSGCRKMEVVSLTWESLRIVENEFHFDFIGKRGIRRWFRVPEAVYRELVGLQTDSPYVFAAYTEQLRQFYATNPSPLRRVRGTFTPENFGQWFYDQVVKWAEADGKAHAYTHTFRKTGLQYARRGEDVNREVAKDAGVSEGVMMTNYVEEGDEELRARSNRTYHRIFAALPPEVARRFGAVKTDESILTKQLQTAVAAGNWELVNVLSAKLSRQSVSNAG